VPVLTLYLRLGDERPALLDDLLAFAEAGQQRAVNAAIAMLTELHRATRVIDCSYAHKLQGLPIWELKTHARGGSVGGTRIYSYLRPDGTPVVVNAEIKEDDAPGQALREAVRVTQAALRRT
jgi:hypothetical protein